MELLHHPSTMWSLTLEPIETDQSKFSPWIIVHLSFSHWHELHHHCFDPHSPFLDDHDALSKELQESGFRGIVVFPLDRKMLCFHMAFAEEIGKGLPEFVTPGAWSYLKDKVLCYLLENMDFDGNQGLGFQMVAHLDISTVDVVDADDHLEDCSDGYEGDCDEDFGSFRQFVEENLDLIDQFLAPYRVLEE